MSEMNLKPSLVPIRVEAAPLRSKIIESIRHAIEHGVLKPGDRLIEKDLCERLEVSRTSLREALRELEAEEIVAKNYSARKVEYLIRNKKDSKGEKKIDTNILKTQERIEKILGLKVNILNKKNNSGRIIIEYKDLDQFELVSDLLTKS